MNVKSTGLLGLDFYKELLGVNTALEELMHLIYAKPILLDLAISEMPDDWFGLDYKELLDATKEFDFFSKSVVFGVLKIHLKIDDLQKHGWIHLPTIVPKGGKEVWHSSKWSILDTEIQLPLGVLTGYELSELYPKIAAINLFINNYGIPLINDYRSISDNNVKEASNRNINDAINVNQWKSMIIDLITKYAPKTGLEFRKRQIGSLSDALQFENAGWLFFDEPKIYGQSEIDHWKDFLDTYQSLEENHQIDKDHSLLDGLLDLKKNIIGIKEEQDFDSASKVFSQEEVMVPFFPLFAWDFENKANTTLALRVESKVEELENIAEDSDQPLLEKKLISDKLYKAAHKESLIKGPFIGLDRAALLETVSNDSSFSGSIYPYLQVYLTQLELSTVKQILSEQQNDQNNDLKVYSESKTLGDLAMLAILLKAGKYFSRQDEAIAFVAKHFKVDDMNGYPVSYRPSSIAKSLESIKNSVRKQNWTKLKRSIEDYFNSEY
jgi:hypothetical protein